MTAVTVNIACSLIPAAPRATEFRLPSGRHLHLDHAGHRPWRPAGHPAVHPHHPVL